MVGLFAGIGRFVGFMVGGWLAGWFVCYPVCRSVEPSDRLAISNLSPTDQPIIHSSIWSLTNRTKTVLLSVLALDQCLNFRNRGFVVSQFSFGWLAAVGLPDPCLQVAGQVWSLFHLASQRGIPSLLDRLSSDRSGNAQKGVCDLLCQAMYQYIYILMLHIQLPVLPIPPTRNGLKSIFGDTTIDSANTPWIGILEKAFFLELNHEFLYVILVFEVFLRLSQVWGRDMLPPPRDLHPLPYPHFEEGEF